MVLLCAHRPVLSFWHVGPRTGQASRWPPALETGRAVPKVDGEPGQAQLCINLALALNSFFVIARSPSVHCCCT